MKNIWIAARVFAVTALAVAFSGDVLADSSEVSLAEFAQVAPIVEGTDAVRKIELPFEVLVNIRGRDRGDLRILNSAGLEVPTKLFGPATTKRDLLQSKELPFFPVRRRQEQGRARYSFQFSGGEKAEIDLSAPGGVPAAAGQDFIVLLDGSPEQNLGALVGIRLSWREAQENLIVPLLIEGSNDLQSWQIVSERAVISELSHNGVKLKKDEIGFAAFTGKYLRITWPASATKLELQGVVGQFKKSRRAEAVWREATLNCKAAVDTECGLNIGRLPLRSVQLQTDELDYFYQFTMHSRTEKSDSWTRRSTLQQYRLNLDNTSVSQITNSWPATEDSLWKLGFEGAAVTAVPQSVLVRWQPLYLVFMAQGPGPFTLAFGSAGKAPTANRTVDAILRRSRKELVDLELVTLGPVSLNAVEQTFWTRDRIESYALWSVLLVGVGVMLWIAIGLFRRMSVESGK